MSIGRDIIKRAKTLLPNEATLSVGHPPFQFLTLTLKWRNENNRDPNDEELLQLWRQYKDAEFKRCQRRSKKSGYSTEKKRAYV
jgi:hypothetical protein